MKGIVKDWLVSAEGDLLLIKEIIDLENLTHLSAFHAQQAIEKSFKAIIEEFELDLLILLDQLYIDSRYPGEMGLLPDGKPTVDESTKFFNLAQRIYEEAESACLNK